MISRYHCPEPFRFSPCVITQTLPELALPFRYFYAPPSFTLFSPTIASFLPSADHVGLKPFSERRCNLTSLPTLSALIMFDIKGVDLFPKALVFIEVKGK